MSKLTVLCSLARGGKSTYAQKWQNISESWFRKIRNGARVRGLLFEIDLEFIDELLHKQNYSCAITGEKIFLKRMKYGTGSTASLDRIDSNKGYLKNNVWWTHKDVNKMKWELKMDRFLEISKKTVAREKIMLELMKEINSYE